MHIIFTSLKCIIQFFFDADIGKFLDIVDDIVSGETCRWASVPEFFKSKYNQLSSSLKAYPKGFEQDLIPCQRVLDVLTTPYLKLAKHMNGLTGTTLAPGPQKGAELLYYTWANAIIAFCGDQNAPNFGLLERSLQIHQTKLSALVAALLNTGFLEVRRVAQQLHISLN